MARRIKRPRVVWLPSDRTFSIDSPTTDESVYQTAQHDVVGIDAGNGVVSIHPLTIDAPPVITGEDTLSDIENSGYRLRRIVGKVFCAIVGNDEAQLQGPDPVICTAGFIILRVDEAGLPLDTQTDRYGPGIIPSGDSPWIWRRSWVLGQPLRTTGITGFSFVNSNNGFNAGSVADGPHVDAKTARIVSQDERAFLVLESTAAAAGASPDIITGIRYIWETRLLATMRTSSGNRRNASR